jgi:antitoxin component YwqK of YwqJK toxin-antitoxin module
MKKLLLLAFVLFCTIANAQKIKKEFYSTKEIYKETTYEHGKRNGSEKFYNKNGIVYLERIYLDDSQNGLEKEYYEPSGKLKREVPYINGQRIGIEKKYYESGIVMSEGVFSGDGQLNGIYKEYYENGILKSEETKENSYTIGHIKNYTEKGEIDNSKTETTSKKKTSDDGLVYIEVYENELKNGIEKWYYKSGKVKFDIPYLDGKKEGVKKEYYENGVLKMETTYSNDEESGNINNYTQNGILEKNGNTNLGGSQKRLAMFNPTKNQILKSNYEYEDFLIGRANAAEQSAVANMCSCCGGTGHTSGMVDGKVDTTTQNSNSKSDGGYGFSGVTTTTTTTTTSTSSVNVQNYERKRCSCCNGTGKNR